MDISYVTPKQVTDFFTLYETNLLKQVYNDKDVQATKDIKVVLDKVVDGMNAFRKSTISLPFDIQSRVGLAISPALMIAGIDMVAKHPTGATLSHLGAGLIAGSMALFVTDNKDAFKDRLSILKHLGNVVTALSCGADKRIKAGAEYAYSLTSGKKFDGVGLLNATGKLLGLDTFTRAATTLDAATFAVFIQQPFQVSPSSQGYTFSHIANPNNTITYTAQALNQLTQALKPTEHAKLMAQLKPDSIDQTQLATLREILAQPHKVSHQDSTTLTLGYDHGKSYCLSNQVAQQLAQGQVKTTSPFESGTVALKSPLIGQYLENSTSVISCTPSLIEDQQIQLSNTISNKKYDHAI